MSTGPMTTEHLTVDRKIILDVLPEAEVKAIEDYIGKVNDEEGYPDDIIDFLNTKNPKGKATDEELALHGRCRKLFAMFKEATGMDIELTWVPECQSCYDNAEEGVNWEFAWNSVWKKSPEAEALERKYGLPISTSYSTVYG